MLTSRLGAFARSGFYVFGVLRGKYGMDGVSPDFKYTPDKGVAMHNAAAAALDEDFFVIEGVKTFKPEWLLPGWAQTQVAAYANRHLFAA